MFPVENLSSFVIFLSTLDSSIFWFNKPVPISPIWVFHLHVPLLVRISLLETDKFVEVSEHVNEDATVYLSGEEVLKGEVNAVFFLEDVNHLADDVLEIKI